MPRIRQQQALISLDFLSNCCVRARACFSFPGCLICRMFNHPLSDSAAVCTSVRLLSPDTCQTVPQQIGRVSPGVPVPRCELDRASHRCSSDLSPPVLGHPQKHQASGYHKTKHDRENPQTPHSQSQVIEDLKLHVLLYMKGRI